MASLLSQYGSWIYLILFIVLFAETGLVVTPFLPGDSLLFVAGALAAVGSFNILELYLVVVLAVILGDTVNYWIGHEIGPKAFNTNFKFSLLNHKLKLSRILKREYLERAEVFYEKHGGKAVILARFIPIIRTFAPFVAGIGKMNYGRFITFNVIGGLAWTALFVFGGYFLGNIPVIKENFQYTVILIIAVSMLPIIFEMIKNKIRQF